MIDSKMGFTNMRIGIDVGGTFTDIVLIDDATGRISYTKTFTTPRRLAQGVMDGIAKIIKMTNSSMDQVDYLVHGTTIGTNAIIERKGVKTGLITTEGFRDVLEIGRVQRPAAGLYDFSVDNPPPLVPRYLRLGVRERVGSDGKMVMPLNEDDVVRAVKFFKREKVESIAVSLLFSFLNSRHERRVRDIIDRIHPGCYVSLSSDIAPEFREYERTSTTVLNAYLLPIVERYIESLEGELNSAYGRVDLRIMQASGGSMTAQAARSHAVHTINSGPAGGAVAGSFIGSLVGERQLITVDMGGTSFDIALIDEGVPQLTSEGTIVGYPMKIPVIGITTIGAGGGSIAWIDQGGALNVGPMSAGAEPGPACYERGGDRPTVTDANLILGRLNPDYFLGGEIKLNYRLAEMAIKEHVAKRMKMTVTEGAAGIIRLVNANMVKGISVNSIERGYDPREFSLIAFGGAGPLHAVALAKELGMAKVIIPPLPGNLSALGLLVSDTRHDFVATLAKGEGEIDPRELLRAFLELEERGRKQLASEGVAPKDVRIAWSADMRYEGQSYELNTPVDRKATFTKGDIKATVARFHKLHQRVYEYSSQEETVEFINLRVTAIGKSPPVRIKEERPSGKNPGAALKERRRVYFDELGFVATPIYDREMLRSGNEITGPAIIEEVASGTVLLPGTKGIVDPYSNIIITLKSDKWR